MTLPKVKLTKKNLIKFFVYNTVFIVTLIFVYQSLDWDRVNWQLLKEANLLKIVPSFLLFLLFYVILALGWGQVLSLYTDHPHTKKASITFLSPQIFKYLPTSIFILSIKSYFTHKFGIRYKTVGIAVLIEHAFQIYSALATYLLFSGYAGVAILMVTIEIIGFTVFHKRYLNLHRIPLISHLIDMPQYSFQKLIKIIATYHAAWLFSGLAFQLFASGLGNQISFAKATALQSLSTAGTILAVFSPGGLGVKEYILSFSKLNLAIIVFWRLMTVTVELLVTAIGLLIQGKFLANNKNAD